MINSEPRGAGSAAASRASRATSVPNNPQASLRFMASPLTAAIRGVARGWVRRA